MPYADNKYEIAVKSIIYIYIFERELELPLITSPKANYHPESYQHTSVGSR